MAQISSTSYKNDYTQYFYETENTQLLPNHLSRSGSGTTFPREPSPSEAVKRSSLFNTLQPHPTASSLVPCIRMSDDMLCLRSREYAHCSQDRCLFLCVFSTSSSKPRLQIGPKSLKVFFPQSISYQPLFFLCHINKIPLFLQKSS